MTKPKKGKKIRAEFRKRYESRARKTDFTREYREEDTFDEALTQGERVSGKGRLTRRRTIVGEVVESQEETGFEVHRDVVSERCSEGTVLSVHGLACQVMVATGEVLSCAIRGILKSLSTEVRHVVVAGDRVLVQATGAGEGVIERVEPRYGIISRTSRGRQHILVANVDQLIIVSSAAEPGLKPNLIDRMLVTAEKVGVQPLICINKIDLVDAADLQPIFGVYGQMGYRVLPISAKTGQGIAALKGWLRGKKSVVAGQSGVGKSSLLNAIEPGLNLRVSQVSAENQKGRHTTTSTRLIGLNEGGFFVDTPGIRQFQLWDVIPEEVCGFFRDIRPYINRCRFPDCSHTHEDGCGVKDGVADNQIDLRRYESYMHLRNGDFA
ncbi:MAG: ribosome small subunit-dependent GTPase A [Planctomycetota bacterium]|nr:ribosome small subunit-dependent GTPase A [Planctomycetota bacterium]